MLDRFQSRQAIAEQIRTGVLYFWSEKLTLISVIWLSSQREASCS